jgi:segregation and condensation protein B
MKDWQRIEAVLFGSGKYLTEDEIIRLSGVPKNKLKAALHELQKHYGTINSSLDVFKENNSWKLNVKEEFAHISKNVISEAEMSKPVMETLALIAYKSPVFQSEIVDMKGAGVYDYVALLEDKGFITKEKSGRSYKLKVTPKFFDYFDISGDAKLRAMFKGVKKPESVGSLEVYTAKEESEKDDEFHGQVIERMKKVETTSQDNEEKKKFLDDFDNKFEKTRTNIDETDKELNEFRREQDNEQQGEISIENDDDNKGEKIEDAIPARRERKVIFGDENKSEYTATREQSEKLSDSEENYPDKILKNFESILDKLDSPKEDDEEEEELDTRAKEEIAGEKEKEELKDTIEQSIPKKMQSSNPDKLPLTPERIEKIKEEAIKEKNKLIHAQQKEFHTTIKKAFSHEHAGNSKKAKTKSKSKKK